MKEVAGIEHERLTTLWSILKYYAQFDPGQVATYFEGKETTYSALMAQADALAARLAVEGCQPSTRVGYLGKNSDIYFALLFALARIGAVLVPLNWRLATEELEFIVADSTMSLLISDEEFATPAANLAKFAGCAHHRLADLISTIEPDGDGLPPYVTNPEAVVFQVYTSGTTGRPKGAMLTHRNLLALRAPGYRAGLEWFPERRCTVGQVLPVAHIAGTAYAIFGFYAGARIVIGREFDPGQLIEIIESERISHILLAPAAMQQMLDHPAADTADLSSLRFMTYGAAPIPEALLRRALGRLACGFVQMYGMSEAAGGVVALEPSDHLSKVPGRLRSAGRAMPGVEIAVIDEDWTFLPAGAVGEIVVRSGAVMPGYWKRPEANAEVFGPDGWMRTGDIGSIADEGYLFVLDRAKDTIISGGENVYPAEVENAIFGHPDILDVAVVSAPSELWGEEVVAIVVPRPGSSPDLASIRRWLDGRLARFKFPKRLEFAESLPRNAGNKLLRRVLREPYWSGRSRRIN